LYATRGEERRNCSKKKERGHSYKPGKERRLFLNRKILATPPKEKERSGYREKKREKKTDLN